MRALLGCVWVVGCLGGVVGGCRVWPGVWVSGSSVWIRVFGGPMGAVGLVFVSVFYWFLKLWTLYLVRTDISGLRS